jgi:hypothetical protein
MKHFGKLMLLTLGLGLFAVVLSSLPSHPTAAAAGPAVTVLNTPLPVQGTVAAQQSGVWNVNAAQSGAWSVGINNTPGVNANITNGSIPVTGTVAVSSLPSVTLGGSVNVGNTSANPVITQAADNPALQPFQFAGSLSGALSLGISFGPPEGAVLVMEYLMAECDFSSGPQSVSPIEILLEVDVTATGVVEYAFAPTLTRGNSEVVVSQPIHIYADNTTGGIAGVSIVTAGTLPTGTTCSAAITGHLVRPLPPT